MKVATKRYLHQQRRREVRAAVYRGDMETRSRSNPEQCPGCDGRFKDVYRWLIVTVVARLNDYDGPDPRWFCLCGFVEWPAADSSPDVWREGGR
jgi:hypothetical protein